MGMLFLLILAAFAQWKCSYSTSISGVILEDITFLHKTFPVPPSTQAIIEYDVYIPPTSPSGLTMGIYTTQDHTNIQNQCTETRYGQLGNKHLHQALNSGHPACQIIHFLVIHCKDTITVQDFIPRSFSFSFGFECYSIHHGFGTKNLYQLIYNITISELTNRTDCASNWGNAITEMCRFETVATTNLLGNKLSHYNDIVKYLREYINNRTHPNRTCYQHFIETACHILFPPCQPDKGLVIPPCKETCYDMLQMCKTGTDMADIFGDLLEFNCDYLPSLRDDAPCYYKSITCSAPQPIKHGSQWPMSHPISTGNYPDSQEYNLYDMVSYSCNLGFKLVGNSKITCKTNGQWSALPQCLPESTTESITKSTTKSITKSTIESITESTTKSITESTPKSTTKSTTENTTESTVKTTVEPITEHKVESKEQFPSTPLPKTGAKSTAKSTGTSVSNTLLVLVPSLFFLLGLQLLIVAIRYRIKYKAGTSHSLQREQVRPDQILTDLKQIGEPLLSLNRKQESLLSLVSVVPSKQSRKRIFDAFIIYHFDSDDDFVVNSLLPELEENRNFKLCIHSRNFTPGRDIIDNIEEAIEGSNSAIIIMSQEFVDSMWCKEEFTHCYIENMKDAAFNLFVIMMQPADTLVNISNYMKTFFETKTYLQVNDPELFSKLATHLEDARNVENDDMTRPLLTDDIVELESQI